MSGPPPPPPPHGEAPKSTAGSTASGLPPGKYDIFIIPPHSSGSGFLYLPSLKPNVNSFAAGFASALVCVLLGSALAPPVMAWWNSVKGAGGAGMLLLVLAVGVGAWALGRLQLDGGAGQAHGSGSGGGFSSGFGGGYNGGGPAPNGGGPNPNGYSNSQNGYASGPPPGAGPMPGSGPMPGAGSANGGPKSSWQRGAPPPGTTHAEGEPSADAGASESSKGAWERAREETKRKEEERKAREAERRRKEELERKLREQREKEAREREAREREAQARRQAEELRRQAEEAAREVKRKEAEAQERRQREELEAQERRRKEEEALEKKRKEIELAEQRLKEAREREARERDLREKRRLDEEARAKRIAEAQAREKKRKEDEAAKKAAEEAAAAAAAAAAAKKLEEESKPRGSTYAFSAVGEKTNPWPRGRPKTPPPRPTPPSPTKKPPPPSTQTYKGTNNDDDFSYRPYDKKPARKNSFNSSYSQSSYAASQSTSRTTPPPSHRAPYTTKDPNKIVIKAVYAFNNAFLKTPTSQLVAGVGSVTDGLILNITTEGLFIDDDVRGVPQREWDVKAWTMKLVEVWCPSFRQGPAGSPASARVASAQQSRVRRLWGLDKDKPATAEETDALVASMLSLCKNNCRLRSTSSASDDRSSVASDSAYGSINGDSTDHRHQTGDFKTARLHVLRASIRDQEGKKYVFVISEEESWKVSVGLQRLRKGTQVRALGVSGMSANDAKATLEHLGWA
jgi:hypothetical protein